MNLLIRNPDGQFMMIPVSNTTDTSNSVKLENVIQPEEIHIEEDFIDSSEKNCPNHPMKAEVLKDTSIPQSVNEITGIELVTVPNPSDIDRQREEETQKYFERINCLCRLCAEEKRNMFDIFEITGNQKDIAEIINKCLPIQVHKNDTFSKKICFSCKEKIEIFQNFCELVLRAETNFFQIERTFQETSSSDFILKRKAESEESTHLAKKLCNSLSSVIEEPTEILLDKPHEEPCVTVIEREPIIVNEKPCVKMLEKLVESLAKKTEVLPANSEGVIRCNVCNVTFKTLRDGYFHALIHARRQNHPCNLCDKVFINKRKWERHYKDHAPPDSEGKITEKSERIYVCEVCTRKFSSDERLAFHLRFHETDDDPRYCKTCNKYMRDETKHYDHWKANHRHEESGALQRYNQKVFKCTLCEKCFKNNSSLARHLYTNHYTPNQEVICHICSACNEAFLQASAAEVHIKACKTHPIHSTAPNIQQKKIDALYRCEFCQKCFTSIDLVRVHQKCHNGPEPYICTFCGKTYSQFKQLTAHSYAHRKTLGSFEGTEDFLIVKYLFCQQCNKRFVDFNTLTRHRDNHMKAFTGERPYICKTCGKAFKIEKHRDDHQKAHTYERPFSCNICAKTFTSLGTLREHKLYHDDIRRYKCDFCDKSFVKLYKKKMHMFVHTGERPYNCDVCSTSFRTKAELSEHKKIVHALESVKKKDKKKIRRMKREGEMPVDV